MSGQLCCYLTGLMGACVSLERLWPLSLNFFLSLTIAVGSHYVCFNRVQMKNKAVHLMFSLCKLPCKLLCHALFATLVIAILISMPPEAVYVHVRVLHCCFWPSLCHLLSQALRTLDNFNQLSQASSFWKLLSQGDSAAVLLFTLGRDH